jgi:thymidine kinase
MAKLYFRYGTVGSAKTLNLLAVAHSYEQQSKRVLVIKPALDNRFGETTVKSRAGLERDADLLVNQDSKIDPRMLAEIHCVLVDEAQFLSSSLIEQLRRFAIELDIPVICYGLRQDFRTKLFEGAQRLFELADEISEIKPPAISVTDAPFLILNLPGGNPPLRAHQSSWELKSAIYPHVLHVMLRS